MHHQHYPFRAGLEALDLLSTSSRPRGGPIDLKLCLWNAIGYEKANAGVAQPCQGGWDQVSVPQVPLLGHGGVLKT